jgi:hypothetical protein
MVPGPDQRGQGILIAAYLHALEKSSAKNNRKRFDRQCKGRYSVEA